MKIGGRSYSQNAPSKGGIKSRAKCKICNREYKQDWTRNIHEQKCKEYHEKRGKK